MALVGKLPSVVDPATDLNKGGGAAHTLPLLLAVCRILYCAA